MNDVIHQSGVGVILLHSCSPLLGDRPKEIFILKGFFDHGG